MEKQRSKIVKAEIARSKRAEQLKKNIFVILDWMTLILLIVLMITAFVIDGFGFASIPMPIYLIGIGYILFYLILTYKKFTK